MILLFLVASPTYVHRPSRSTPWVVTLPFVELVMIWRHPPGLYAVGKDISLVVNTILEFGKWRLIVLVRSNLVLDWSTARLCSAMQMMSACILVILSSTCLNCS